MHTAIYCLQSFSEKLLTIIDKSIYEDIAEFYNLKTQNLIYFKFFREHSARRIKH